MSKKNLVLFKKLPFTVLLICCSTSLFSSENAYLKSAETLPKGALELEQTLTKRSDKGAGEYTAHDYVTTFEYGVNNHFTTEVSLKSQSIDTTGLLIDGYLPGDQQYGITFSGFNIEAKYKFLNTAENTFGLSAYWELDGAILDQHSGRDKDTWSLETGLLLQKYLLEGQMVWLGNLGLEATYATRAEIEDLPSNFEWPTFPEVEIELKVATGLSYRVFNNCYLGIEALYEEEYETEVGKERYSLFLGPTIHYARKKWSTTIGYIQQIRGGGEAFDEQDVSNLHLIEKTKNEWRVLFAYNF